MSKIILLGPSIRIINCPNQYSSVEVTDNDSKNLDSKIVEGVEEATEIKSSNEDSQQKSSAVKVSEFKSKVQNSSAENLNSERQQKAKSTLSIFVEVNEIHKLYICFRA